MKVSREGWQWTPSSGLKAGLPSIGVIEPTQNFQSVNETFDVVVIGAGYTGLTAARDTSTNGLNTLLLEGRDRIGGRTWSSNIEGYPYEIGGTWVHWFQPHVYRELSRYGLNEELVHSTDFTHKRNFFSFETGTGRREMSHEEEDELFSRAIEKFVNVDGNLGRTVMPFPFNAHWNKDVLQYSNLSVADRIAQISHDLSSDEQHAIEAFVLLCSGGTRENSAFLDFLRWWAAGNYNYKTLLDTIITFKLKCGQSGFAIKFFKEALATGNFSYAFNKTVSRVDFSSGIVQVQTVDGQSFQAKRLICTVPLNVLSKVQFSPALDRAKQEAATLRHVNQCVKIHAEIQDPDMRSWSGVTYPNNGLVIGLADGRTPAGTTHCVFFGCNANLHGDEDITKTLKAVKRFAPMDVERLVFHNWSKDEFAEGAWVWYRPGMETKYLKALRKRQGPVLFANSDWASGGWRSFIDGAIQSGTEAAKLVRDELKSGLRCCRL
ncbi:uncharacterized protein A1O9_12663 [Exophiala aquamarina CBS 119918]|uniref:Amine oxidase n=1 Tax=Exophiala aquamarina CBS 119918 TaxID=1182545 RepID=A0A072NWD0_9EURO|nr:uncharacterized protein A1O9_12663 [Exophiala aquamarina CBS 119918]KEF51313.1 hypothetical protein A1O9_12663 [Exophiala aquamarina CBS 119918]